MDADRPDECRTQYSGTGESGLLMNWSRIPWFLLDALAILWSAGIVWTVVTGGGDFSVLGHDVRVHHAGNLIILLLALGTVRVLGRSTPFLGVWPLRAVDRHALAISCSVRQALDALTESQCVSLVLMLAGFVLVVKLSNAALHPGFFSGDDVEVQEMTFATLFHWDWRAWDIRSAFYPMTFIFPVQALLVHLGAIDPGRLVFAGRAVVAVLSTLSVPLVFRIARRLYGQLVALIAAVFLAFSSLSVGFGSTELPRPISTVFVLLLFGAISAPGTRAAALAGLFAAIAGAVRFSEFAFLVPAAAQLALERRIKDSAVFVAVALAAAAGIQGASDYSYWGHPFVSLTRMIDFTLVHQLSTRGYEPAWYYLTTVTAWTDVTVFALALYATYLKCWKPALWAWLPLVFLSTLPHKEPRYLLPIIPFVAILASFGLWSVMRRLSDPGLSRHPAFQRRVALLVMVAIVGSVLFQLSQFRVGRSDGAVRLARALNATTGGGTVAIEQPWRFGGKLYLPSAKIIDVELDLLQQGDYLALLVKDQRLRWIAIEEQSCAKVGCAGALSSLGFTPRQVPVADSGYLLFYPEIDLHFHDLRYEAGSRRLEEGWPLHDVAYWLGHANVTTTAAYLNSTKQHLHELNERVPLALVR